MARRGGSSILALIATLGALMTHAGSARADDKAAATVLFDEGMSLMAAKDYPRACAKLREAVATSPGLLGAMLWLGDCYDNNGQYASAWAQFRQAATLATDRHDPREKVARKRVADLEPKLSYLTIVVEQPLDGLELKRDGETIGRGAWGTALPVDSGEHVILATAPHRRERRQRVTLAIAERQELRVAPLEMGPPDATGPGRGADSTEDGTVQRAIGFGVAAVGVVGIGLGAYFGLRAKSQLDDSNADAHCRQPGDICDDTGRGLRADAKSSATISTVAFVAGSIALAGGAALVLTAPRRRVALAAGATASSFGGALRLAF